MSALLASQRRNFINFLGPDLKLSTSSGAQQHISSNIFALFRITELFRDSRTSKPCLGSTQYAPHRRFTPRPLNQPRRPSYPRHHDSLTFDTLKGFHAPTYYQGKSRPSVKLLHDGPNHCSSLHCGMCFIRTAEGPLSLVTTGMFRTRILLSQLAATLCVCVGCAKLVVSDLYLWLTQPRGRNGEYRGHCRDVRTHRCIEQVYEISRGGAGAA